MIRRRTLVNCVLIRYQDAINAQMEINVILAIKIKIEKYSQMLTEDAIVKVNIPKTITNNVFYVP